MTKNMLKLIAKKKKIKEKFKNSTNEEKSGQQ